MNPAVPRFLLVDADAAARGHAAAMLRDLGFAVDEATGSVAALALLKTQRFGLVIAAADLPGVSGFDLLQALRTDPALRHLPLLMIVASGCREQGVRAVQGGAAAYLVAPYQTPALDAAVRAILRRCGALPPA